MTTEINATRKNTRIFIMEEQTNSASTSKALIRYDDVSIRHDDFLVVSHVSFTAMAGDFIFLTGPVGSGKSSIMRTVYADLDIADGSAEVLGYDLTKIRRKQIPDLRKRLGIVFQDYKLLDRLSVAENLAFVVRATGIKQKDEINRRIEEALTRVGLAEKRDKMPAELSGGERQRAAIARAIVNKPEIILADEPTGNLDRAAAFAITQLLEQISESGTAVIMSTHNLELVDKFEGKVYTCCEGNFSRKEGATQDTDAGNASDAGSEASTPAEE